MKKRLAVKIYRKVYRSMYYSFISFSYYSLKTSKNEWILRLKPWTAPYTREQYAKALIKLKKSYRTYVFGRMGTTPANNSYNKRFK